MTRTAESAKRVGEGRLFFSLRPRAFGLGTAAGGWTLIELVITMTVMSVLTLAIIPIVRTSVRRQKEQRLREALREMRLAIDEFHRDTVGMQCGPGGAAVLAVAPPLAVETLPNCCAAVA